MAQPPNERVTREHIEKAIVLAKKGQYQKARYMLKDLHHNPRAAKLLKQMEGRHDKFQGNLASFANVTAVIIVVLGLIVVYVAYNLVLDIRDQADQRESVYATFRESGIVGNEEFYVDLVYFCYEYVGDFNPNCMEWGEEVITTDAMSNMARACVVVDDDGNIQYRGREVAEIAPCFIEGGIPDPIGYTPPVPEG